jgi:hypothetical protein
MKRDQAGKGLKDEPLKDGFYDDIMDATRYGAEHILRQELIDPKLLEALDKTDPRRMYLNRGRDPWQSAIRKVLEHAHREQGR